MLGDVHRIARLCDCSVFPSVSYLLRGNERGRSQESPIRGVDKMVSFPLFLFNCCNNDIVNHACVSLFL